MRPRFSGCHCRDHSLRSALYPVRLILVRRRCILSSNEGRTELFSLHCQGFHESSLISDMMRVPGLAAFLRFAYKKPCRISLVLTTAAPALSVTSLIALTSTMAQSVFSWTSVDPRQSTLFNSTWGAAFRFVTESDGRGSNFTVLLRATHKKEERVARFEWKPNGGLGRVILGKQQVSMQDLCRPDPQDNYYSRLFPAPDGNLYRWRPHPNGDILLYDNTATVVAFYRPVRPVRTNIGDVHGELHFLENAGAGTVMHPPFMNTIIVSCMLFRYCAMYNI